MLGLGGLGALGGYAAYRGLQQQGARGPLGAAPGFHQQNPLHANQDLKNSVRYDTRASNPYRINASGQIVNNSTNQAVDPNEAYKRYF